MIFARWAGAFHEPIPALVDDVSAHASRPDIRTISTDPRLISTVEQLTPDQIAAIVDPGVPQRSGRRLDAWNMAGAYANADTALFKSTGYYFTMDIVYLWCDMTVPLTSFTAAYAKKRCEDAVAEGTWKYARKAKFVKIEGGNHFVSEGWLSTSKVTHFMFQVHWHEPERFLSIVLHSLL